MFTQSEILEISGRLSSANSIVITTHRNPDADAIGSSLGLCHLLRQFYKGDIRVWVPDTFPDFLHWMPDAGEVKIYENETEEGNKALSNADLIFCLDYNHPSRTALMEESLRLSPALKVMIDHHQEPDSFATYRWSDTTASSTCELVVRFADAMGIQPGINKDVATCLYTGIMTDTGSFRFSATSPATHRTIARLMETGIAQWKIHEAIFNQNTYHKLRLWGYAFQHKLEVLEDYRTAFISLSAEELSRFQYEEGDLEGLVNYALSIKGVVMGVLFSERKGKIRISFRSVGDFSVNRLSRAHFQGGGHENAAGGVSDESLNDTLIRFKQILSQYAEALNRG